jgi:hypothetical protein
LSAARRAWRWRLPLVALACIGSPAATLSGQSVTVRTVAGALQVQAPGFGFVEGPVLDRLREGRSVRVDLELLVLEGPQGAAVGRTHESFALSFDLWEERFAVTRLGTPSRSVSHLRAKAAEAWCLQTLSIPTASLGRVALGPFWIRLAYRVQDAVRNTDPSGDEGFTLRTLIDRLSRRGAESQTGKSVEAGPFRLTN